MYVSPCDGGAREAVPALDCLHPCFFDFAAVEASESTGSDGILVCREDEPAGDLELFGLFVFGSSSGMAILLK